MCVLTTHCEWRSCSRTSGVASVWHNAIASVPQPWQQEEPPDDGRRARCSLVHCCRFPLERHQIQIWVQCYVAGCLVKVLAEAPGCSLAPGREGLSGLPHHQKPARSWSVKGWSIYPPSPMAAPAELSTVSNDCTCKKVTDVILNHNVLSLTILGHLNCFINYH